jgi:hypothetical protein
MKPDELILLYGAAAYVGTMLTLGRLLFPKVK